MMTSMAGLSQAAIDRFLVEKPPVPAVAKVNRRHTGMPAIRRQKTSSK